MNTPWGARWSLLCLLGLDDTAGFVYQNAYLLQPRKFPGRLERFLAVAKRADVLEAISVKRYQRRSRKTIATFASRSWYVVFEK
jgi:hypothetical protein